MPKLVATKGLRYATRRLLPNDEFVASNRDARLLVAIGKARYGDGGLSPLDHDRNGKKGGAKAPSGDKDAIAKLRADYAEVLGKKPFPGWDAAELQRRIDEALGS